MKILVTGANGQMGKELQALSTQFNQFDFIFADVAELDITNQVAVEQFFDHHKFNFCINCAAFTAVDKAESEAELAHAVNVSGVQNLASACLKHQSQLIQLSTDYVYHNNQNTPFKEHDPTNPQSVYASTKLAGDNIALEILPSTMVIRTSWVYSAYGHNFVKTMLRLGREREQLGIIFDQIGTPTYAHDLALAILTIIKKVVNQEVEISVLAGVFHYSNEGVTSWYDFAKAIFRISYIECNINAIETKDYPTPAKRPPFSLLNKAKIKSTFGIKIPHWEDSLANCIAKLEEISA